MNITKKTQIIPPQCEQPEITVSIFQASRHNNCTFLGSFIRHRVSSNYDVSGDDSSRKLVIQRHLQQHLENTNFDPYKKKIDLRLSYIEEFSKSFSNKSKTRWALLKNLPTIDSFSFEKDSTNSEHPVHPRSRQLTSKTRRNSSVQDITVCIQISFV